MNNSKTSICFVVHKGALEVQALLLATSIKYFNHDKFNLYACVPRHLGGVKTGVSKSTKLILKSLGVSFIEVNNPISEDYLIGNKLGCLSNIKGNYKVFLDTDIMCCKEIHFPKLTKMSIAVKPADRKTINWNQENWQKAYKTYSETTLNEEDLCFSSAFIEPMLPYFNAGVIAINDNNNFSQQWSKIAKNLDDNDDFDEKRPWLDQLALPLTIKKLSMKVTYLSENLNFPANIKPVNSTNLQLVHYHRPKNIARNNRLLKVIKDLSVKYPETVEVFKSNKLWSDVYQLAMADNAPLYSSKNSCNNDSFITEIPESGFLSILPFLTENKNFLIENDTISTLKPLGRRFKPWGIAGHYLNIRKNKTLQNIKANDPNKSQFHYSTFNSINYISSISRILLVMPNAQFIGCFNNPVKTVAKWLNDQTDIEELLPKKFDCQWLDKYDRKLLNRVKNTNNLTIKLSLLWNFYAAQLLKFKHTLNLIDLSDFTENPNLILRQFDKNSSSNKCIQFENKTNEDLLISDHKKQLILNITTQFYHDLKESKSKNN